VKLAKSKEAEALQQRLLKNAAEVANQVRKLTGLISAVQALARADGPEGFAADLTAWSERLGALVRSLGTIDDVIAHKAEWEAGWITAPPSLAEKLESLTQSVKAKPDQSASVASQAFLTLAQDRLNSWRSAQRAERQAAAASARGQDVYKAYCDAADEQL